MKFATTDFNNDDVTENALHWANRSGDQATINYVTNMLGKTARYQTISNGTNNYDTFYGYFCNHEHFSFGGPKWSKNGGMAETLKISS